MTLAMSFTIPPSRQRPPADDHEDAREVCSEESRHGLMLSVGKFIA
jgi:hypothetical protein